MGAVELLGLGLGLGVGCGSGSTITCEGCSRERFSTSTYPYLALVVQHLLLLK